MQSEEERALTRLKKEMKKIFCTPEYESASATRIHDLLLSAMNHRADGINANKALLQSRANHVEVIAKPDTVVTDFLGSTNGGTVEILPILDIIPEFFINTLMMEGQESAMEYIWMFNDATLVHETGHMIGTDFQTMIRWQQSLRSGLVYPIKTKDGEWVADMMKQLSVISANNFAKTLFSIFNIIEDGFIENLMRQLFPGVPKRSLTMQDEYKTLSIEPLSELVKAGDTLPSALEKQIFQYALTGRFETGDKTMFTPEMLAAIDMIKTAIDNALVTANAEARLAYVNECIAAMKSFYENSYNPDPDENKFNDLMQQLQEMMQQMGQNQQGREELPETMQQLMQQLRQKNSPCGEDGNAQNQPENNGNNSLSQTMQQLMQALQQQKQKENGKGAASQEVQKLEKALEKALEGQSTESNGKWEQQPITEEQIQKILQEIQEFECSKGIRPSNGNMYQSGDTSSMQTSALKGGTLSDSRDGKQQENIQQNGNGTQSASDTSNRADGKDTEQGQNGSHNVSDGSRKTNAKRGEGNSSDQKNQQSTSGNGNPQTAAVSLGASVGEAALDAAKFNLKKLRSEIKEETERRTAQKQLTDSLEQEGKQVGKAARHSVYNGNQIRVERAVNVGKNNIVAYNRLSRDVIAISKQISRHLLQVIKEESYDGDRTGLYFGETFNPAEVYRGNGRYFSSENAPQKGFDLAISMLADESGSMTRDAIEASIKAGIVLEDFTRSLNIPFFLGGYTTGGLDGLYLSYVEPDSPDKLDRYRITAMPSTYNFNFTMLNCCLLVGAGYIPPAK